MVKEKKLFEKSKINCKKMENTVDTNDMENPSNEEDINKKDVETKTRDFINSVVELAKTEANQTKEELSVLEQMNNVAASEYAQIADTITSISSFKDDLHKKHEMLAKHIVEIDKIDMKVPTHFPNKIPETINIGEPNPRSITQIIANKENRNKLI